LLLFNSNVLFSFKEDHHIGTLKDRPTRVIQEIREFFLRFTAGTLGNIVRDT
jgi:hypothetical protein